MDGSARIGFMAVFAVSSSVAFLAHQVNKRLISNFMKRIEFEFGTTTYKECEQQKVKKVRFVTLGGAVKASKKNTSSKNGCMQKPCLKQSNGGYDQFHHKVEGRGIADVGKKEKRKIRMEKNMPLNRVALYKGIREQRMLFPKNCL